MIPNRPCDGTYITVTWLTGPAPIDTPIPAPDDLSVERVSSTPDSGFGGDIEEAASQEFDEAAVPRVQVLPTMASIQYVLRDEVVPGLRRGATCIHPRGFYAPCIEAAIRCGSNTDRPVNEYLDDILAIRRELAFVPDRSIVLLESSESWSDRWSRAYDETPNQKQQRRIESEHELYSTLSSDLERVEVVDINGKTGNEATTRLCEIIDSVSTDTC